MNRLGCGRSSGRVPGTPTGLRSSGSWITTACGVAGVAISARRLRDDRGQRVVIPARLVAGHNTCAPDVEKFAKCLEVAAVTDRVYISGTSQAPSAASDDERSDRVGDAAADPWRTFWAPDHGDGRHQHVVQCRVMNRIVPGHAGGRWRTPGVTPSVIVGNGGGCRPTTGRRTYGLCPSPGPCSVCAIGR